MTDIPQTRLGGALAQLHASWGWFVGLGVLSIIAGLLALGNMMVGTLASVLFISAMMLVTGVAHIVHAFKVREWGSFALWLLTGILYTVAALLIAYNPLLGAGIFTLFIGIALIATGIMRIVVAIGMRHQDGWLWMLLAGLVTLLLGLVIMARWPINSLWVLGLFLGVDLLCTGFALVLLGLRLKPR